MKTISISLLAITLTAPSLLFGSMAHANQAVHQLQVQTQAQPSQPGLNQTQTPSAQTSLNAELLGPARERYFNSYVLNFANDERYTFTGNIYSIISHVDDGWDTEKVSFPGATRLREYSKRNLITSFGFVSSYGGGAQEFGQTDVNFIVNSESGSHNFAFPNARGFLVGGGNLSLCLCEALRDIVHGTEQTTIQNGINVLLVTDAVYDDEAFWPISAIEAPKTPKFTLQHVNAQATDDIMEHYLHRRVIGNDEVFCPGQNYYGHKDVNAADYIFEIYRGARKTAVIGNSGRVIRLILSSSTDLDANIAAFGMTNYLPVFNYW